MHEALMLMYVTVTGQAFHLSPKSIHQGQQERGRIGKGSILGEKNSLKSLAAVHVDVFIQNCISWSTLNVKELRMVSRLAGVSATWNETEILLGKKKGMVGQKRMVLATAAELPKSYGEFKMNTLTQEQIKAK